MNSRQTILIVDDVEMNRAILDATFSEDYRILEAENGKQAMEFIMEQQDRLAAILLDVVMPVMDGFEVLEEMQKLNLTHKIPVFLITAENSQEVLKRGYELGVVDIIGKPIIPFFIRRRIGNVIRLNNIVNEQDALLREQAQEIRELNSSIIETLSTAIEFRDCESGEHVTRIRDLTMILLHVIKDLDPSCRIEENDLPMIADAAVMHDVGKIAIPDGILNKPGRLTAEEFEIMKTHTVRGCELLDSVPRFHENPVYKYAYDICRHHHERWDGRGYPDGLKGDEISIQAQVVSVADVYDALVSDRVYKKAYHHDTAYEMIRNGECGCFSPLLMEGLSRAKDKMKALYKREE
nr:HD domain-containing phosphohydrolase [uncultured Blautia sp.]